MADDIKKSFGGFDAIMNEISSFDEGGKKSDVEQIREVDPEDINTLIESLEKKNKAQDNDSEEVPAEKEKKSTKQPKKVDDENEEEPEEVEEEVEDKKSKSSKKESDDKSEEIDLEEKEIVDAFSDLFAEELGWKYEDDEKPSNIKDLVKHMQSIIDENSQPKYASDDIKELDEFVKNGGKLKDFYKNVYTSEIDIKDLDTTKEFNQKAIIKENLRNKGYSEQRIEKLISKYEDTESLEDEANDSLDEVKEYREKTKKELLESQKNHRENEIQEQLSFVRNVEKIVKTKDNVRGIPISDKERKELLEYIFKPTVNGSTKYQEEYMDSLENLVESAYFTKNRNTIIKDIQKKATSDAVKNLKLKLKSQGKSIKNTDSSMEEDSKVAQLWEIAGKELKSFK